MTAASPGVAVLIVAVNLNSHTEATIGVTRKCDNTVNKKRVNWHK